MRSGLAGLQRDGALIATSLYWAMVAELELRAGRHAAALDAIHHGIVRAKTSGERFWYPELERMNAITLHAVGRCDEARKALKRAQKWADRLGVVVLKARLTAAGDGDLILVGD
jgi:predicted ATPase